MVLTVGGGVGVEQLYVWIGCNSARMGNLYAALPTRWVFSSALKMHLMVMVSLRFKSSIGYARFHGEALT